MQDKIWKYNAYLIAIEPLKYTAFSDAYQC